MTPTRQTDEEMVRERWSVDCGVEDHRACCGPASWRAVIEGVWTRWHESESSAWSAARAFTEARREEIRQVREEIIYMQLCIEEQHDACGVEGCGCEDAAQRTLGRLEAHLQGLLRGWKETE